jgi:phage-related protein
MSREELMAMKRPRRDGAASMHEARRALIEQRSANFAKKLAYLEAKRGVEPTPPLSQRPVRPIGANAYPTRAVQASEQTGPTVSFVSMMANHMSTNWRRPQTNQEIVVSTVYVNHRVYKLKAELFNILSVLPIFTFTWNAIFLRAVDNTLPEGVNDQYQLTAAFVSFVQKAATVQELMDAVLILENSLPLAGLTSGGHRETISSNCSEFYWLSRTNGDEAALRAVSKARRLVTMPYYAVTAAAVACRLFSLDRIIRYETLSADFQNVLSTSFAVARTRIDHSPRCMNSLWCSKALCHFGRCIPNDGAPSRLPDLKPPLDQVLVGAMKYTPDMRNSRVNLVSAGGSIQTVLTRLPSASGGEHSVSSGGRVSTFNPLAQFRAPAVMPIVAQSSDINDVQAYVPKEEEIADMSWV